MRLSKQKTPLARLRTMLTIEVGKKDKKRVPLSQKDIAEWLGLSVYNVQSIETGRVRLTEENAEIIARQTSVDPAWLLAGDLAKPPTTWDGRPFSQSSFDLQQLQLSTRPHEVQQWLVSALLVENAAIIAEILLYGAERRNFANVSTKLRYTLDKFYLGLTGKSAALVRKGMLLSGLDDTTRPKLEALLDDFESRLKRNPGPK